MEVARVEGCQHCHHLGVAIYPDKDIRHHCPARKEATGVGATRVLPQFLETVVFREQLCYVHILDPAGDPLWQCGWRANSKDHTTCQLLSTRHTSMCQLRNACMRTHESRADSTAAPALHAANYRLAINSA